MTPTRRKAQTTQPEIAAAGEGTVPPKEPGAPPGTGGGEPPRPEPPFSGAGESGSDPQPPARQPFDLGDVVAIGATMALGLLLLVVLRGRRTFS